MYSLELPWRGDSNEYVHYIFLWRTVENFPLNYHQICTDPKFLDSQVLAHQEKPSSRETLSSGLATRVDSNRPAQPQKLARVLKF